MGVFQMSREERYLITSADELTWKFDRPVVFLGEWCRRHERRHVWQNMDGVVAEPYGLGQAQKDADLAQTRELIDKIFPLLCHSLNKHHNTQHGERYWRITLGHWVSRYVNAMLNRIKTLEQCLDKYNLSGTTLYGGDKYTLETLDTNSTIWAFNDDRWNIELMSRLLTTHKKIKCPVEFISDSKSRSFRFKGLIYKISLQKKILKWGRKKVAKLISYLSRDNDGFILNSYLPAKEEMKLELAFGQVPQLWRSPEVSVSDTCDIRLRQSLGENFKKKSSNTLEAILYELIFELLPICYLEGFNDLNETLKKLPWPKTPKFIFTSNNFDTDEIFKLWVANKVECGIKNVVGQHGGNYGTYRYMQPSVEEMTSDMFLTWGWTDGLRQHTPAFVIKNAGQKNQKFNSTGGLLLIQDMVYHRIDTWDRSAEYLNYFEDQVEFTRGLSKGPTDNLTVRLLPTYRFTNPCEKEMWHEINPIINIDTGYKDIGGLISESRLVVFAYDSTGILEMLSQDVPTMAFWQNGLEHLRENIKPSYQLLVDVGIVHLSPESLSQKINEVWSDVNSWWCNDKVKDARIMFCKKYARTTQNPVDELKTILTADDK